MLYLSVIADQEQELDRAYLLRVSYIEIYNETLRDLLNFKKGPLKDEEKPVIHTAKVSLRSFSYKTSTYVLDARAKCTLNR